MASVIYIYSAISASLKTVNALEYLVSAQDLSSSA